MQIPQKKKTMHYLYMSWILIKSSDFVSLKYIFLQRRVGKYNVSSTHGKFKEIVHDFSQSFIAIAFLKNRIIKLYSSFL